MNASEIALLLDTLSYLDRANLVKKELAIALKSGMYLEFIGERLYHKYLSDKVNKYVDRQWEYIKGKTKRGVKRVIKGGTPGRRLSRRRRR